MDVEGSEWSVIRALVTSHLLRDVKALIIEIHSPRSAREEINKEDMTAVHVLVVTRTRFS